MSWKCKNCKAESEDTIAACWKCGFSREWIPPKEESVSEQASQIQKGSGNWGRVLKTIGFLMLIVSGITLFVGIGYEYSGRSKISSANDKLRQLQTEDKNLDRHAKEQNDQASEQIRQRQGTGLFAIPRMYFTLPQDEAARRRIQQNREVATKDIETGKEMRQKADEPIWYGSRGIVLGLLLILISFFAPQASARGSSTTGPKVPDASSSPTSPSSNVNIVKAKSGIALSLLSLGGVFLGGFIAYQMSPTMPFLGGHVPFEHVITFGTTLQGIDQEVIGSVARTTFMYTVFGAIVGGFAGIFLSFAMQRRG